MSLTRPRIDAQEKLLREACRARGVYRGAYQMFNGYLSEAQSLLDASVGLVGGRHSSEALKWTAVALARVPTETEVRMAAVEHPTKMFFRHQVSYTRLQHVLPSKSSEMRLHDRILSLRNELRDTERKDGSSEQVQELVH